MCVLGKVSVLFGRPSLEEVPRKENLAVAECERGGDPALGIGGHGADLYAKQREHGQRNRDLQRYGGCRQAE